MRLRLLLAVLLLVALPLVNADKSHMKVLAVSEKPEGYEGLTADLYLEIQSGDGRVFIESFPITKMDTQISTRFAKEIACSDLQLECDRYNFFYTIRADTAIVGGPSASAAAAVLTAAAIKGFRIRDDVALTGTINSGGLIGPVGGLKEKIGAAPKVGIKKVLIPLGERIVKDDNSSNSTDLIEYGRSVGVDVVEVSDLRAALFHVTGERINGFEGNLSIDSSYSGTMSELAFSLCNKSESLRKKSIAGFSDVIDSAKNLSDRGLASIENGQFYSAASYCFGANVRYSYVMLALKNMTRQLLMESIGDVVADAENLEKALPEIETIADLQSYSSVQERLFEAKDNLNLSIRYFDANNTKDSLYSLAYAKERVFSAFAWSRFMGKGGKKMLFDKDSLEASCRMKISEAEERFEYASLYFPRELSARKDIDRAYDDLSTGRFALCLSKAAKAKADSDVLLSSLSIDSSEVNLLIDRKLSAAKRNIARSIQNGIFPIVGYSYFEYSSSLKDSDPYSALLYAEYALELSNMDIYFKKSFSGFRPPENLVYFAAGALVSGIIFFVSSRLFPRQRPLKKRVFLRKKSNL